MQAMNSTGQENANTIHNHYASWTLLTIVGHEVANIFLIKEGCYICILDFLKQCITQVNSNENAYS